MLEATLAVYPRKFRTCSIASKRIKTMCDYFERTSQMLEFVVAINEILKAVRTRHQLPTCTSI